MIRPLNNIPRFCIYNQKRSKECSFGAASDYSLQYVQKHREQYLPQRVKSEVKTLLAEGNSQDLPTLYDLHLDLYKGLKDCATLDEVKCQYPEFSAVVDANVVLKHKSPNIKKIIKKMPLEKLATFIIAEHWANLKTFNEIAEQLELKDRSALGWYVDKMHIPSLGKHYQTLLKSTDEKQNSIIAEKTRTYNQKNREKRNELNAKVSKMPEVIEFNRRLTQEMWDRMPELRERMVEYRRIYPGLTFSEFNTLFWGGNAELRAKMSEVRKEIAEEMRSRKGE